MAVLPEGVSWLKVTIWSVAAVAALALAVLLARFSAQFSMITPTGKFNVYNTKTDTY
mgnify:CR=1 FL=1